MKNDNHFYLCKSEARDGGYEYREKFILVASQDETLPHNIDELLTAWDFGVTVKDVEEQGDEVWSDTRIVSCWVDHEVPNRDYDVARKYLNSVFLNWVLSDVEFGDERDVKVA